MKMVRYSPFVSNRKTKDNERAILPTIIFARDKAGMITATAIAIGWWAWGIGIVRTAINDGDNSNA